MFHPQPIILLILLEVIKLFFVLESSAGLRGTKTHWVNPSKCLFLITENRILAEILKNYEKERVLSHINSPINMNHLRISQGGIGKISAYLGGTEIVVWNRFSHQVTSMIVTNASTKNNHKF